MAQGRATAGAGREQDERDALGCLGDRRGTAPGRRLVQVQRDGIRTVQAEQQGAVDAAEHRFG